LFVFVDDKDENKDESDVVEDDVDVVWTMTLSEATGKA
jgi:hypothetical protein